MAGIYANDADEALYPILATDSDGQKPDCSVNRYTLTFPSSELPPANAFWSVTTSSACEIAEEQAYLQADKHVGKVGLQRVRGFASRFLHQSQPSPNWPMYLATVLICVGRSAARRSKGGALRFATHPT